MHLSFFLKLFCWHWLFWLIVTNLKIQACHEHGELMLCAGREKGLRCCCVGLSSIPENEWKLSCVQEHVCRKVQKELTPAIWKIWAMLKQKYLAWVLDWFVRWTELFFFVFLWLFCSVVRLCALFLCPSFFVCQICHETGKLVLCHNFDLGFHLTCVGLSFFCQQINDWNKTVQNYSKHNKWQNRNTNHDYWQNKMKIMNENNQKIGKNKQLWSVLVWWNHHVLKTQRGKKLHSQKRKICQDSVSSNEEKVCEVTETNKKTTWWLCLCSSFALTKLLLSFGFFACCLCVVRQNSMGEFFFSFFLYSIFLHQNNKRNSTKTLWLVIIFEGQARFRDSKFTNFSKYEVSFWPQKCCSHSLTRTTQWHKQ